MACVEPVEEEVQSLRDPLARTLGAGVPGTMAAHELSSVPRDAGSTE